MAPWVDDDDDQDTDLVKNLRKQIKALTSERDEVLKEVGTLRPQVRKTSMSSVLSELGFNKKIAGLIPDSVDTTKEAVTDWIKDYGDLFQIKQEDPPKEPGEGEQPPPIGGTGQQAPVLTAQQWAEFQNANSASGAIAPDIEKQQIAALTKAAAENSSFDQFVSSLQGI